LPDRNDAIRLWEDLDAGPGEMQNLTESEPKVFEGLLELWRTERVKIGIVLPQDL